MANTLSHKNRSGKHFTTEKGVVNTLSHKNRSGEHFTTEKGVVNTLLLKREWWILYYWKRSGEYFPLVNTLLLKKEWWILYYWKRSGEYFPLKKEWWTLYYWKRSGEYFPLINTIGVVSTLPLKNSSGDHFTTYISRYVPGFMINMFLLTNDWIYFCTILGVLLLKWSFM